MDLICAKRSHDYDFKVALDSIVIPATCISEINVVDEANNIAAEINNENESDDHDIGTFVNMYPLDCFLYQYNCSCKRES